jgi:RNA polymerase sigma-70 factor, ECF subfamily
LAPAAGRIWIVASFESTRQPARNGTAPDAGQAADSSSSAADCRAVDLQLVQGLIARDPEAWAMFVERFQRLVLARVAATAGELRQSLDEAEMEDLCAEVFAQLIVDDYAALRRFEGRSTLSTWLCVVTRRIALRRLTTRRRELPAEQGEGSGIDFLAGPPQDDPLRLLIDGEDRLLLAAGLEQLNPRQRQLVHLLYFDGCSYREASQQLQIPMNSIGPTLQRIQQRLRVALKIDEA